MVKNYILREKLYPEENRLKDGISIQTCVVIDHIYNKKVTYYNASKQNGVLIQGGVLHTNVPLQGTERLIIYVSDSKTAIKLAEKWCLENTSMQHKYKVIGVDNYFSPLD